MVVWLGITAANLNVWLPEQAFAASNVALERSYEEEELQDFYEDGEYYDEEDEEEEEEAVSPVVKDQEQQKNVNEVSKEEEEEEDDPLAAFGSIGQEKSDAEMSKSGSGGISPDVAFKQFLLPTAFIGTAGYMFRFHINEDKSVEEAIAMFEEERKEYFNITSVDEEEGGASNATNATLVVDDEPESPPSFPADDDDDLKPKNIPPSMDEKAPSGGESIQRRPLPDIDALISDSQAEINEDKESNDESGDIEDERERLKRMFGK